MSEPFACERHGEGVATRVCRHLHQGIACGFESSAPTADDPWPDAWCDACASMGARSREIVALCNGCYEEVRQRNRLVPPELVGATSMSAEAVATLLRGARQIVQVMQDRARDAFAFGSHDRWAADYDAGTFMLKDDQRVRVLADLQIVGSYSARTWLWSWANEINERHNVRDVAMLRALGEVRGIGLLATAHQEDVDPAHCWNLTSLACYLLDYDACYRAPMDDRFLYFILKNLRWVA